jgi:putative hydrolase of the HAD superfamily
MTSTIEGILFDFGGVLATFYRPELFQRLEGQTGLLPGSLSEILWRSDAWRLAEKGLISDEEYWRRIAPRLNLTTPGAIRDFQDQIYADVQTDPRMVDLVRRLHGPYRTGLLSNTSATDPQRLLQRYGLDGLFDQVILSAAVDLAKPDPAIYRLALDRLGTSPQTTLFIDDYEPNVQAATEQGIQGIHFVTYDDLVVALREREVLPLQPPITATSF